MSHDDELSLFLQEVADVRPLRSDHIAPGAGNSLPTEAQLARREAATAEQLTLDHLSMEAVPMLDPHDIVGFKRDGVQEGVYKKLRLGKYELQGSLDLHHKTIKEARTALVQSIGECEVRDPLPADPARQGGAQHPARPAQEPCQCLAAATACGDGHPQRRASPRRQRRPLCAAAKERAQEDREPRTSPEAPRLTA